ncbi:MAG: aldehyde dehydrogenase family protein [Gammaproteobacteria bacterium]|nr:aldehyde dehydrogenase family protein [Gammaproteobacteria bacterium]
MDAIALANDSEFGLGGAIFSSDTDMAWHLAADEMETGTVAVNGQVQSDPRLPFGGIRHSGYGRELGKFGIREFVNVKTVSRFDYVWET